MFCGGGLETVAGLLYLRRMQNTGTCKVLIIEDERAEREIYKRYLQRSSTVHFEFTESDSAAAGIELARKWLPDCILLDFQLPDMDGLEVLPWLRQRSGRLPCAVV